MKCLAGTLPLNSSTTVGKAVEKEKTKQPISKTVHFIWGLKEGRGSHARFGFLEYLSIRSALIAIKPKEVIIHHAALDKSSIWFKKLERRITLQYHDPKKDKVLIKTKGWQAAHRADLLRLEILKGKGGIYLDLDVLALRSFDTLLKGSRDMVMGMEGGNRAGMANAVIISRPNAKFLDRWIESYSSFSPNTEWNYHSVTLPLAMSKQFPDEICALSPTGFFWPTWTNVHVEFMHTVLEKEEKEKTEREIEKYQGALFDGQLAYHAWSQMAWDRYLKFLTPEKIKSEDTRFNMLMRRFLED